MRKLLLGLLVIILFAFSVYMAIYGVPWESFQVNGIPAIKEENTELDQKILKATNLKEKDYPQSKTLLEAAYKKLITEKENYEQILALGVDENGQPLNKIQEYEIEKIWVTMGNYAKKQGVDLKLDVTSNNSISKTYDLTFTVTGGYIQITDFLYDVERDRTLVFKLENFKMEPASNTDVLAASFVCKDIKLNITDVTTNNNKNENDKEENTDKNKETSTTNETKTTNSSTDTNSTNNTDNTANTNNT